MKMTTTALSQGDIQFYDDNIPSLHPGTYVIKATLSLPNAATDNFQQDVNQQFTVDGPQFSLSGSTVNSVFPADNANGDFGENLPYLLLQQPSLPWEREIVSGSPGTPWMALLVLQADEVLVNPATNSPVINSTVSDFLAPETGILKPAIVASTLSDAVLQSQMNSIRITTGTFTAVTPRQQELPLLAHVRQINPVDQETTDDPDAGFFSVVIANRFPYAGPEGQTFGAVNYVHLVSLEGLTPYLTDQPDWGSYEAVQLVSLANWSFTCVPQPGQTFADLAENLVQQEGGNPASLLLNIPITPDGSAAATRIQQGYTALSYHTLPGNDTFAWYRGPFTAVVPQPLPETIVHYQSVSDAMIYDQENAVFDHSYATAWTIGRLMALADPVFIAAARQIQTETGQISDRLLENSKKAHLAGITDLNVLARTGLTRKQFGQLVQDGAHHEVHALAMKPVQGNRPGGEATAQKTPVNYLFPSETPPALPSEEARWFRSQKTVRTFLGEGISSRGQSLTDWLSKLMLLQNIPFNHLVPDQRMLPSESARFFYVDPNWLKVLYDGAISVNVHSGKEVDTTNLMQESLWTGTMNRVGSHRKRLLGQTAQDEPQQPQLPAAGMLMRSALVSGWPGLAVNATADGNQVNILRIDRVAPNILLVLWDAVPDTVTVSEPQQGIAFGVEDGWIVPMRSLSPANLGAQINGLNFPTNGRGTVQDYMRPVSGNQGGRVLQLLPPVADTPGNYLIPGMTAVLGLPANLTPSQWAIEMVKTPQVIVFNPLTR